MLSGRCRARREMARGAISAEIAISLPAEIDRGHAIRTNTQACYGECAFMHVHAYARTAALPCPARHRRHRGEGQEGSAGRPGGRLKRCGAVASVGLGFGVLWAVRC